MQQQQQPKKMNQLCFKSSSNIKTNKFTVSSIIMAKMLILFAFLMVNTDNNNAVVLATQNIFFPLLMPDVQPLKPETYLCTAFKMSRHEHQFIVEYLPNATKETAHHILIYGCEEPGYVERDTPHAVWNCGEMTSNDNDKSSVTDIFPTAPVCGGESQIVYSWAMNAPSLKLPNGVGFKVGHSTGINYLVLQVHYAHVHRFINGETDQSGITLRMLPQNNNEINKLAGVLLLATDGRILGKSTEQFEAACPLDESIQIHPFAFRTHTHKFGLVVTGYRIDQDTGRWQVIGKGDPQKPQMFYPTKDSSITVRQGDWVAARCTMYNWLDNTVRIGMTGDDEMCNFYIMYYVNRMDRILKQKICTSPGPPYYYWKYDINVPKEIDIQASEKI